MTTYSETQVKKIKVAVSDMTVNDSEMCVRWNNEAWSILEILVLR